jgi:hypothetical protein
MFQYQWCFLCLCFSNVLCLLSLLFAILFCWEGERLNLVLNFVYSLVLFRNIFLFFILQLFLWVSGSDLEDPILFVLKSAGSCWTDWQTDPLYLISSSFGIVQTTTPGWQGQTDYKCTVVQARPLFIPCRSLIILGNVLIVSFCHNYDLQVWGKGENDVAMKNMEKKEGKEGNKILSKLK